MALLVPTQLQPIKESLRKELFNGAGPEIVEEMVILLRNIDTIGRVNR